MGSRVKDCCEMHHSAYCLLTVVQVGTDSLEDSSSFVLIPEMPVLIGENDLTLSSSVGNLDKYWPQSDGNDSATKASTSGCQTKESTHSCDCPLSPSITIPTADQSNNGNETKDLPSKKSGDWIAEEEEDTCNGIQAEEQLQDDLYDSVQVILE